MALAAAQKQATAPSARSTARGSVSSSANTSGASTKTFFAQCAGRASSIIARTIL